jgi:hypothetical protein
VTKRLAGAAGRELAIVPRWVLALAAVVFVATSVSLVYLFGGLRFTLAPQALILGVFSGSMIALLIMAAGYVNRDAARRGMSPALWTVLVLVIPNAIGFILYFVLRAPIRVPCPACGAAMAPQAAFCSKCGAALGSVCAGCGRRIGDDDRFCASCGRPVAA